MPRLRLTEKSIAKLKAPDPSGKQKLHFDAELKGFAVLCSGVSNVRTFIAQRDVNNRTRRVTLGAVNEISLEEARERAANTLDDLRRGTDPKRRGLTLRLALEDYLKARKNLRPDTVATYRKAVEGGLKPWLDLPLGSITSDMIVDRHAKIVAEATKGGRYKGEVAANMALRMLRLLWNFQPDLGEHPVKILTKQKRWNPEPPRERMVTTEQMPAFYDAVSKLANPIAADHIKLMLFTGMRVGETSRLAWDDVDFKERVIRLPATSTKAKKKLDIPMSDFTHDLLVARRSIGNAGFVFPGPGKNRHVVDAGRPLDQVAKATGIKISAHDLRRTYVTIAETTKNVSSAAVMALVNHSLGSSVHANYFRIKVEDLREPVQLIADRIKTLCGIAKQIGDNVVGFNTK
jgi:integrase